MCQKNSIELLKNLYHCLYKKNEYRTDANFKLEQFTSQIALEVSKHKGKQKTITIQM